MRTNKYGWSVALSAGLAMSLTTAALAAPIQVIYCKKPGHAKAILPGAVDLNGNPEVTEWKAMDDLSVSADGSKWFLGSRGNTTADHDSGLVAGSGTTGGVLVAGGVTFQEGRPALTTGGGTTGFFDFVSSAFVRFNSSNKAVFGMRARSVQAGGGTQTDGQRAYTLDGTTVALAFKQLDPYTGMVDTTTSGDETVGNSIGSYHLLDDGRIGTQESTINNINSARRPALAYNLAKFKQINVDTVLSLDGMTNPLWSGMTANSFYTTPNGAHWINLGTIGTSPTVAVMSIDGQIMLQAGVAAAGTGPLVGAISQATMAPNGDWVARGRDNSGTTAAAPDWVVRNGAMLAKTGDPITPGSSEHWGDTIGGVALNSMGDYLIIGNTDNAEQGKNEVVVFNGTKIILREGDPIDLDDNGMFDDNAWIGRGTNTLVALGVNLSNGSMNWWLTDNRVLYGILNLRDGELAGADINVVPAFGTPQAFIRTTITLCSADFDGSNNVDADDLFAFLDAWFAQNGQSGPALTADVNHSGTVDADDLFDFLDLWFAQNNACP